MTVPRATRSRRFFLIAALFVAMNRVVASAPLTDWWLPLVLLILGLALVFAPGFDFRRGQPDDTADRLASGVQVYQVAAQQAPRLQTMTIPPDSESAEYTTTVAPESAEGDDLTIIRGIGPKSAAALKAAGINSFHKLASSSDEAIHAALTSGSVRLIGDIDTWAHQAGYAARADWDGLRRYIDKHQAATGD